MTSTLRVIAWLFVAVALVAGVDSCGSSDGRQTRAAARIATESKRAEETDFTRVDQDRDNDVGAPEDDENNNEVLDWGRPASPADKRAVTALLRRFYAAARSSNGARACSLLYSTLAEGLPEDYGQSPPGPSYSVGSTCARVMTLMFEHFHSRLAAEAADLNVRRVRVKKGHGIVIMAFGRLPEREIYVEREGRRWSVSEPLDAAIY